MSGSTRVSRYQKGKTKKVKTNLDLLEQEIVSGNGICWAICKSAPHADNHDDIPPFFAIRGGNAALPKRLGEDLFWHVYSVHVFAGFTSVCLVVRYVLAALRQ